MIAKGLNVTTPGTATSENILATKTAWVNGAKLEGTMVNNGAKTYTLPINGKYTIPAGYHNGLGYVNQSIPTQGAMTLNPGTSQKIGNVSGKYMTGNITVPAVSISPSIIKKNHRLTLPDGSSVIGTFEGWVASSNELYKYGTNNTGLTAIKNANKCVFEQGYIKAVQGGTTSDGLVLATSNKYDLSKYNLLKAEFIITGYGSSPSLSPSNTFALIYPNYLRAKETPSVNTKHISTINISSISAHDKLQIEFSGYASNYINGMQIFRIWLE